MMQVEKPWEFKEEVDIMEEEEDDAGALHPRERKNRQLEEEEEQKQTVFFDSISDNATVSITGQQVIKVGQSGKELEKQRNFDAPENNKSARNAESQNGICSNALQRASSSSETTADGVAGLKLIATIGESANILVNGTGTLDISNRITNRTQVHEIEVDKDESDTDMKPNIEEYDLEKILDEQETHDLYCPNCKSCITRRVILRKRKRTMRQALQDEPPKKPQIAEPSTDASNQMADERHDQEAPQVFRCLSCFTFFIPTGCGFNIFRVFERRDMNQQVQGQHPSASHGSDNRGSWLLSCFQTVDSPKRSADAVKHVADPANDSLLSGSRSTSDKISPVEDNMTSERNQATIEKTEQLKITLPAGPFYMVQTTSSKEEEKIKQSDRITSSSVTVHESSSTTSTISSSQSKTGFMQTEARWMVTGQRDIGYREQISLSEPPSDALTDAIHMDRKEDVPQNTAAASTDRNSFFNQKFFRPQVEIPNTIPTQVLPEVLAPVIPAPVQSESQPHVTVPIIPADIPPTPVHASDQRDEWDKLKAVVYGGLIESITSLSVVSAAAASGIKTSDILVLGIANLIGGLPIILHNIADIRNPGDANENERVDHYRLHLGRRSKYQLHVVIAVPSYILFGLLPPVIYGSSFRKSDNRESKMMAVAAASLACTALLAIGKAHVRRHKTYFTTLVYYLLIGLSCSGLSYVTGVFIRRLLAHFGLIDQGGSGPLLPDAMGAGATAWASY